MVCKQDWMRSRFWRRAFAFRARMQSLELAAGLQTLGQSG